MCDCKSRILQPVTEDVKVFEDVLSPFESALVAGKSVFGAIPIKCFFRGAGTVTELLGFELMERCNAGGTLLKLPVKFVLLGYNGYSVAAGEAYAATNATEEANPILSIDKLTALEYEELGSQIALGFKQARPGTFVKNPKVFTAPEIEAGGNTTVYLHILANGSGTYSAGEFAYDARIRVKYRRYDHC